jgi:arginase
MKEIKVIEVKSELGAGTRGASLGIDAVKMASLTTGSDFFARYNPLKVRNNNELLFQKSRYEHAKYINGVFATEQRVSNTISHQLILGDSFPVVIAGDHSNAAGTICGVKSAYPHKRVGIVWIDAHADLHSPYTTPSGNMHGMPLAIILNEDNLECKINEPSEETIDYWDAMKNIGYSGPKANPGDIVFVAVRSTEEPEDFLIKKHKIKNFKTEDVRKRGVKKIAEDVLASLKDCDIIYISFDVDSIDSSYSVGTGTPVENGLTPEEAVELNALLVADKKVVAWEMVEVNPALDSQNKMAHYAFNVLDEVVRTLEKRFEN